MEKNVSKKEPKYVAFSTQKGGAGKTTLTVLVASYLHYVKGYNVAVIDCDYPQHSIFEMRERDFAMVEKDEYYKGIVSLHSQPNKLADHDLSVADIVCVLFGCV